MISVNIHDFRFQVRAVAVVIHDGAVLVHCAEGDAFWALPGGRVEVGEEGAATIVREMTEELGEAVECGPLLYLMENFFTDGGTKFHEIGLYYPTSFRPGSPILATPGPHFGIEPGKRLRFEWIKLTELTDVPLYPVFLRQALALPELTFRHVVQRD